MGQRADDSSEKALAIQQLMGTNKANVDQLITNIGKAADASMESAKNVLELEERTRRIDKIVDAIVMVTVQTKMLAVNGNVEAARAGEYRSETAKNRPGPREAPPPHRQNRRRHRHGDRADQDAGRQRQRRSRPCRGIRTRLLGGGRRHPFLSQ